MKYIASYLLSLHGGNSNPGESDIAKMLSSVGIVPESGRISSLLSALQGKNVEELIAEGLKKLATVPSAGAAPAPSASVSSSSAPAKAAEADAPKKEETDDDIGFDLFG